ncbi:MAG: SDR family NAD(P)-dependent oxidoreductase [Planctomycetota bacterium]
MRRALVTGGNRGIGLATCLALLREGLAVVLCARDEAEGRRAAAALAAEGGELRLERVDVGDPASITALAGRLAEAGLAVDVLVNNAAVYLPGAMLGADEGAFLESLRVNCAGPLRLCRAFVPGMLARGYGRVVNVSSGYGAFSDGLEGPAPYSLSKALLNAITVKLAAEVAGRGDVKVNALRPGWVRTRMGGAGAERSPEAAAADIVRAATLPADGPHGRCLRYGELVDW